MFIMHTVLLLLAVRANAAAVLQRRALLHSSAVAIVSSMAPAIAYDGFLDRTGGSAGGAGSVRLDGINGMAKPKTLFSDFTATESGLQLKDYKIGSGLPASPGDRVVLEWTGVTVGYQVVVRPATCGSSALRNSHGVAAPSRRAPIARGSSCRQCRPPAHSPCRPAVLVTPSLIRLAGALLSSAEQAQGRRIRGRWFPGHASVLHDRRRLGDSWRR